MPDKPSGEEIPEDLQTLYTYASMPGPDQFAGECVKLIERIASAEQALRESREEVEKLKQELGSYAVQKAFAQAQMERAQRAEALLADVYHPNDDLDDPASTYTASRQPKASQQGREEQ